MTYAALVFALAAVVVAEIRLRRTRVADRSKLVEQLARTIGIAPTIKVARALGWIGEGDVRSDGDSVSIRLRARKRWRLSRS